MTDKILKLISEIAEEKRTARQYPIVVQSVDIARRVGNMSLDQVEKLARQLRDRGLIKIGKTINYEYYEIIGS